MKPTRRELIQGLLIGAALASPWGLRPRAVEFEPSLCVVIDSERQLIRCFGPPNATVTFGEMYAALKDELDKASGVPAPELVMTTQPMGPLEDLRLIPSV